jgi:uncharacterized RDD family membrane protein YckC
VSQTNPFTPPEFQGTSAGELGALGALGDLALASPGQRLLAAFVDGLVLTAVCVPVFVLVLVVFGAGGGFDGELDDLTTNLLVGTVLILGGLPYAAVQAWLVTTRGQTVGKIALGLRIVRTDGRPVDFVQGVLLRSWVFGLLGAVPCLGNLINITDLLAIFSDRHRTLHDRLADTLVVRA